MQQSGTASRRAFTLVEILIVVVILAILAAVLLPRLLGGTTEAGKKAKAPIVAANDTVCQSNLRQIRMDIDMARQSSDENKPPASLDELKLPSEMLRCPTGREPYRYDPSTGEVHCPHPGHEAY